MQTQTHVAHFLAHTKCFLVATGKYLILPKVSC